MHRVESHLCFAMLGTAAVIVTVGVPLSLANEFGPLSRHMVLHILIMNVAAPIAALALTWIRKPPPSSPRLLWLTAAAQVVALWLLHAPAVHASIGTVAQELMAQSLLGGLALMFWMAILGLTGHARWHAPAVLIVTGKLVCLLAALLIFSPRLLYGLHHSMQHAADMTLADQHLAGLLMVIACPLSYLLSAAIITLRLIDPQQIGSKTIAKSHASQS